MIELRSTKQCVLLSAIFATLASLALAGCNKSPAPSVVAAVAAPVAAPIIRAISATLTGASEVPAVASSATGTLDATYNAQSALLAWTVTYGGLSGDVTGAHFHGPAMAGENAGVVVPVTGSMVSPIKGEAMLTAAQAADLTAGKWYFNLHTVANPNGEIRGQAAAMQ